MYNVQPGETLDWFFRRARNHSALELETFGYLVGGVSDGGLVVGGLFLPEQKCTSSRVSRIAEGCWVVPHIVFCFFELIVLSLIFWLQCIPVDVADLNELHEDWRRRGWKVMGWIHVRLFVKTSDCRHKHHSNPPPPLAFIQTHWRSENTMSTNDLHCSAAIQVRI